MGVNFKGWGAGLVTVAVGTVVGVVGVRVVALYKVENGLDGGGCGDGLIAVAVMAEVGVGGVGCVAVAGAAVAVVARCTVLGIEIIPARVVHELALADAKATSLQPTPPTNTRDTRDWGKGF